MFRSPGKARSCLLVLGASALSLLIGGCAHHPRPNLDYIQANWTGPATVGLTPPFFDSDVAAVCDPPLGWKLQPLKTGSSDIHQVWLSPTGKTAYGVIHFKIPFPVGENLVMSGFMSQMKQREGWANLLWREDDANLPGIRFVAEGGIYKLRGNMTIDTWEGWVVYAGTHHNETPDEHELDLAIRARELTKVGNSDPAAH